MNKTYVTWQEFEEFINALQAELERNNVKPTGVYGIPRGGLVIATVLSYRLNIPLLTAPADGCIIVDDIADSGKSLCHYTQNDTQFNQYYIATMFYHSRSIVRPDFHLYMKDNKWVVFPWEERDEH